MKKLLLLVPVLLLAASFSFAQTNATGTSTLSVTVGNEAAIKVDPTPAFGSVGIFGDYTATTPFTYWIRTTLSGKITVQITSDFSTGGPGGGPSVASPPTAGDALTYSSTVAPPVTGSANGVAGLTASTTAETTVATFGATTQSAKDGNSGSVAWTLTNDPSYKAGTYSSAVATFTISAT
jgi:hypothetical protein